MKQQIIKLLLAASFVVAGGVLAAGADEPPLPSFKVGDARVILLSEGEKTGSAQILINASAEDKARYIPDGSFPNAVNAFLVKLADKQNILIDAGFGTRLFNNLQKTDVKPEDISAVLLTHMHSDHVGGLLRDGRLAFPNATIYLSQKELAHWQDNPNAALLKPYFQKDAVKTFTPAAPGETGEKLLPGIYPVAAYGHTPGHTAYLIQNGNERLLAWGDITHAMAIQAPVPGVSVTYDTDPQAAAATRKSIFAWLAKEKTPVAGAHISSPGMGVLSEKDGGYVFTPAR